MNMQIKHEQKVELTEGKVIDDVTDVRGLGIQVMVLGPGLDVKVTRNSVMTRVKCCVEGEVIDTIIF